MISPSGASAAGEESSISTNQSWRPSNGSRTPGTLAVTKSTQRRDSISKATTVSPLASRAAVSSASAASGPVTAAHAVVVARGRGSSLSTAAVTIPSVPSAPMNNCLRS